MSAIFVHSHKFRRVNGEYYSPGGLSERDIKRYVDIFGDLTIVGRVVDDTEVRENYCKVSGPRVRVYTSKDLKRLVSEADYLIARIPSPYGFRAVRYARKLGKPYVLENVVCVWDAYWNHSFKGKLLALPMYLYMKSVVAHASHVLYVSKYFLQERYPTKGKSVGVTDTAISDVDPSVLTKRLEKIERAEGPLILGQLARLSVAKGQEYAIRALPLIQKELDRRVILQFAGNGDQTALRALAKELGVEDDVQFMGSLAHKEVFPWLDSIDIVVHPTYAEGLCRALVEAESRALPCVVSGVGGNVELIDKDFVFSMRNKKTLPKRIAAAVVKIAQKDTLRAQAEKNFNLIVNDFDPEKLEATRRAFYTEFRDDFQSKS